MQNNIISNKTTYYEFLFNALIFNFCLATYIAWVGIYLTWVAGTFIAWPPIWPATYLALLPTYLVYLPTYLSLVAAAASLPTLPSSYYSSFYTLLQNAILQIEHIFSYNHNFVPHVFIFFYFFL